MELAISQLGVESVLLARLRLKSFAALAKHDSKKLTFKAFLPCVFHWVIFII
jgi:hypothetical protein